MSRWTTDFTMTGFVSGFFWITLSKKAFIYCWLFGGLFGNLGRRDFFFFERIEDSGMLPRLRLRDV